MIVKCEQCQTRFKIPDEKVTDKGVKVRCTKCSHTFRVTRDMAQPATATLPAAPGGDGSDPFARFGAATTPPPPGEVTRPGVFALGVEATRPPPAAVGAAAPAASPGFDFSSLTPPQAPPPAVPAVPKIPTGTYSGASPSQVAARPPPAAAQPAAFNFGPSSAPMAAPAPGGFDFAALVPPSAPASSPFGASSAPPAPFDFGAVAPPGAPPPAAAPLPAMPAFDFGAPPPAAAPPRPESAPTQQVSAFQPSAADGFFAASDADTASTSLDPQAARAMFDLPSAPPAASPLADLPPPEPEAAPPPAPLARPAPAREAAPAAPVPEALEERPRRRSAVGIVVNVLIAVALVFGLVVVGSAFLNEGKFTADSLSLDHLKNTFAPSAPFLARDVSNGLYETRAGRAVFFVRGEVENRSDAAGRIIVRAELIEGDTVVRFAESSAGEPASPEELFLIDGNEALEALNRKVEKRAVVVGPHEAAAFVVVFNEYPPDLKGFRVRVSARAVPEAPTASTR